MIYQDAGIILKIADFREADQLFYIYTKHCGKLEILGRGTKKIKSRLNSSMQFFSILDLAFARGKRFDQLTGAAVIKNYSGIKNDYSKIIFSSFGLELVEQLTRQNQPDRNIFNAIVQYLTIINDKPVIGRKDWLAQKKDFVVNIFTALGYKPTKDMVSSNGRLDSYVRRHLDRDLKTEKAVLALLLTQC